MLYIWHVQKFFKYIEQFNVKFTRMGSILKPNKAVSIWSERAVFLQFIALLFAEMAR